MKKRLLTLFLAVCMICTLLPFGASAASGVETVSYDVSYRQTEARTMLKMINDFRTVGSPTLIASNDSDIITLRNLKSLIYDYSLEKIAMQRAAEIAINFSHTRPNNKSFDTAFSGVVFTNAQENLAYRNNSKYSASDVFGTWKADSAENYAGQVQRRNMLSRDYNAVGIACAVYEGCTYWVQVFGNISNPNTSATQANDDTTTVKVEVERSLIKAAQISADVDSINIPPEKSIALPVMSATLKMNNTSPDKECTVVPTYKWKSSDNSIVKISGGKIVGVAAGNAKVTVTALGVSISIPVHIHKYAAKVTEPTCTEKGYTTYTCSCGDSYVGDYVKALGHKWANGKVTKKATCTEAGERTYTCSVCGAVLNREIPALGHTYKDDKCTRCGRMKNPFVDVSDNAVYCDAILWAYYHQPQQVTNGKDDTHFVPKDPCTRAQVVTFIWRAAGCPEPKDTKNPFEDVQDSGSCAPYYKAILWASEKGITTGVDKTHFKPNDTVTRAQFVTFLYRYEGSPATKGSVDNFKDAKNIAAAYKTAVEWAVEYKITTGYEDGTFRPNDICTRWAVVLFMYRDMGQSK